MDDILDWYDNDKHNNDNNKEFMIFWTNHSNRFYSQHQKTGFNRNPNTNIKYRICSKNHPYYHCDLFQLLKLQKEYKDKYTE